jgi:hypothetical protein
VQARRKPLSGNAFPLSACPDDLPR